MDEITYWIYTKRAPCLMNYDEMIKKREQSEATAKNKKPLSISDDSKTPSPSKKKRKLTILDDESASEKAAKNVYFESSKEPQVQQTVLESCKSSEVDINIKNACSKDKAKRRGPQKKTRTTQHKKQSVVASTPKVTTSLRRSLRNSRKSFNDSNLHNSSFEILNGTCQINSPTKNINSKSEQCKNPPEKLANGDQVPEAARINATVKKSPGVNGQYEDLSDVSGFTANYIRSTKLDSSKNGKQIGSKSRKILLKESRQGIQDSTNDNESTHSSQNCLIIDTADKKKTNNRNNNAVLRIVDSTPLKISRTQLESSGQADLDNSLQPQSNSTPRYPKRSKNNSQDTVACEQSPNGKNSSSKRTKDSLESPATRTRSGRSLALKQSDLKSKQGSTVKFVRKKSLNKSGKSSTGGRDSLRDKSGFAACFSDSDDDKPLKSQKYFC